jgi:hypothetical protein
LGDYAAYVLMGKFWKCSEATEHLPSKIYQCA